MENQPFLCRAVQTLHYRQHSCLSLSPIPSSFKQEGKAFPLGKHNSSYHRHFQHKLNLSVGVTWISPLQGPWEGCAAHLAGQDEGHSGSTQHSQWHQHFKGLSISCISSRHLQISSSRHFVSLNQNGLVVSCAHVPLALGPPSCQGTAASVTAGALQHLQGWLRNKPQIGLFGFLKSCKKFQNITGSIKCSSNHPSDRTAIQVTRPRENPRFLWKCG